LLRRSADVDFPEPDKPVYQITPFNLLLFDRTSLAQTGKILSIN